MHGDGASAYHTRRSRPRPLWLDLGGLGDLVRRVGPHEQWQDHGLGLLRTVLQRAGIATDVASTHVYHPQTDRWAPIAPLPTPRSHVEASTFVWNGRIVMAGGRNNHGPKEAESLAAIYDPEADSWSELPNLPKALVGTVLQAVGHQLVLTTGGLNGWDAPQRSTYIVDASDYID